MLSCSTHNRDVPHPLPAQGCTRCEQRGRSRCEGEAECGFAAGALGKAQHQLLDCRRDVQGWIDSNGYDWLH